MRTPSNAYDDPLVSRTQALADVALARAYLPYARAVILGETTRYLVRSRGDVPQALAIGLLGLCPQSRNGEDLAVLLDALVEFAEQDAEP